MAMGPAEIVASLKELCEARGPRLTTMDIVAWIDRHGGYESNAELVAFAKKMKARQYARMLAYEDEESGLRIKRLWSVRDPETRPAFVRRPARHARGPPPEADRPVRQVHGAAARPPQGDGRLLRRPGVLRLLHDRGPDRARGRLEARGRPERHRRSLEPGGRRAGAGLRTEANFRGQMYVGWHDRRFRVGRFEPDEPWSARTSSEWPLECVGSGISFGPEAGLPAPASPTRP